MANTVLKVGDKINSQLYKEFICDTVSDIDNLPTNQYDKQTYKGNNKDICATGSIAFVIATSEVYMLDSSGTWNKI